MRLKKKVLLAILFIIALIIIGLAIFLPVNNKHNQNLNLQDYYKIEQLNLVNKQSSGLLINDDSTDIIAMSLIFKGGSALDSLSKDGITNVFTSMLLKGAGNMNSSQFAEMLKSYGIEISISVDFDNVAINIVALKSNLSQVFKVLDLIINHPNFNNNELTLIKNDALIAIKLKQGYTDAIATEGLYKSAFNNDPYFNDGLGTASSIQAITTSDLFNAKQKIFTQNNLIVGASGNISKDELESNINKIIIELKNGANITPNLTKTPNINNARININVKNATNSDIYIAMKMPTLQSNDYYASMVFNQYLGSGSLTSILMKEVRAKRGLVYTVSSTLDSSLYGNLWVIHATTANNKVEPTVTAIKEVLNNIKNKNYNVKDIEVIKENMEGNYFLNFTSNSKRASNLAYMQLKQYTLNNIYQRNLIISNVSKANIDSVIDNYINPNQLLIVVAGGN